MGQYLGQFKDSCPWVNTCFHSATSSLRFKIFTTHKRGRFFKDRFYCVLCLCGKLTARPLKPFTHSLSKNTSNFDEKALYLTVHYLVVVETMFYNPQTYHYFLPKLTVGKNYVGVSTPAHNCIRVLSVKSFSATPRFQIRKPLMNCCLLL